MPVRPPNRHIFCRDRIVTKMAPVRGNRKIQRTMIVFDPPALGRDRIVSGTSTGGESEAEADDECESHGSKSSHKSRPAALASRLKS